VKGRRIKGWGREKRWELMGRGGRTEGEGGKMKKWSATPTDKLHVHL